MKNKLLCLFVLSLALVCFLSTFVLAEKTENPFSEWNENAESLKTLVSYVESVTDPKSADFIPEADRVATFDMDGTLCAELNPTYLEYYLLARRILTDAGVRAHAA